MTILVCPVCRGAGIIPPTTERCPECKGSGYPPGYNPPTIEEIARYAFPATELEALQDAQGPGNT